MSNVYAFEFEISSIIGKNKIIRPKGTKTTVHWPRVELGRNLLILISRIFVKRCLSHLTFQRRYNLEAKNSTRSAISVKKKIGVSDEFFCLFDWKIVV